MRGTICCPKSPVRSGWRPCTPVVESLRCSVGKDLPACCSWHQKTKPGLVLTAPACACVRFLYYCPIFYSQSSFWPRWIHDLCLKYLTWSRGRREEAQCLNRPVFKALLYNSLASHLTVYISVSSSIKCKSTMATLSSEDWLGSLKSPWHIYKPTYGVP